MNVVLMTFSSTVVQEKENSLNAIPDFHASKLLKKNMQSFVASTFKKIFTAGKKGIIFS